MIDGSEKRNCQLAFVLQNSHVCEKRSNFQDRKRRNKGFESCHSFFSLVVVNIKDIRRFPLSGDFKVTRA